MRKLTPPARGMLSTFAGGNRGFDASGASIPSPIEGWDAVSPIAAMSPKRAVRLINWFPQPDWVEPRKGYTLHTDTLSSFPVETLAAYHGATINKLFAASDDTIYDVTSAFASVVSLTGTHGARYQYINFANSGGNYLYMVNGEDDPIYYDGASWASATITGVSGSDIVDVNAHKSRIWFAERDTTDAWYLPIENIQGAATRFPLGALFTNGGVLNSIGTWSVDAGTGPQDYIVFVSSRGQVAIYGGIDPASDFALVGVFDMGPPIGRRCLTKVGADLAIISLDGVLPLSKAMIFERAAVVNAALTQRIQRVMNQSASLYKDNFGWELISYPKGTRAILNVPVSENEEQVQYVMNTLSGAWCQFTNMNANTWEVFVDDLYFGGNEGHVYLADTGTTDYNNIFRADMMTAFNYFGSRGQQKRYMMCRPLINTDRQITPGLAFNVDFKDTAAISVQSVAVPVDALWDVALWDTGVWGGEVQVQDSWTSVTGLGYCASVRMLIEVDQPDTGVAWGHALWGINNWGETNVSSESVLQVNSFDVLMQTGAYI